MGRGSSVAHLASPPPGPPPSGDDADDGWVERERRIQELFLAALELPADRRDAWLAGAAEEASLAAEVRERLRLDEASDPRLAPVVAAPAPGALDEPTLAMPGAAGQRSAADAADPLASAGRRGGVRSAEELDEAGHQAVIGGDRAYRLLEELGSGGMGTVWLAERADGAFRQQVAIKMLSGGSARVRSLATRFRVERQILAALDHPGIAKLLDGGALADGTPYLVMEYVPGERVDDHCRRRELSVRQRVQLFVRICEAVEAAHQRLIVHRDLKPANILVTADGTPKLLDFGIAKLLAPEAYDMTVAATEHGRAPLTLRYASPEQVSGEPIGTASDVYSLGVVLFELLTERSPYGALASSLPRLARAICEVAPPLPSAAATATQPTLLADLDAWGADAAPAAVAGAATGTGGSTNDTREPARLRALRAALRGDLDAIVLRALRKEPAARYPSVAALAEDLRRYLDGRPVEARGGTGWYRASKFVRRHRWALAGVATLFGVVSAAAVVSTVQARWLAAERDRAAEAEQRARDEADTAREVTEFLVALLAPARPEQAQGKAPTLIELLDRGAERIQRELRERPAVAAPLLETIGGIYGDLGHPERGRELLERAVALRRERRRQDPLAYAEALSRLARLQRVGGALETAETLARSALAIRRLHLGPGAGPTLDELNRLVVMVMELGRYEEAQPLLDDLVARQLAAFGFAGLPLELSGRQVTPAMEPLARLLHTRAVLAYYRGHFREAADTWEQSLRLARAVYGGPHTRIAATLTALSAAHIDLGDYEAALRELDEALVIRRAIQGENHPDVAGVLINRAAALHPLGRWQEVVRDSALAESIYAASLGPDHPLVTAARNNRAEGLKRLGRVGEALALHRSTLAELTRLYPEGHVDVVPTYLNLGSCLLALGRAEEAVGEVNRGHAMALRLLGSDHPSTVQAAIHLAQAELAAGQRGVAVPRLRQALATALAVADAAPLAGEARYELARALRGDPRGREEARALAVQALADARASGAADPARVDPARVAELEAWLREP
jgi:serine/threonine protein kinase